MTVVNNLNNNSYVRIRGRNYVPKIYKNKNQPKFLGTANSSHFDNSHVKSLKSITFASLDNKKYNIPLGRFNTTNRNKNITFSGLNTKEYCHSVIHGSSLACGGISFAQGEASVTGLDTWILRGIQGLMFKLLGDKLGAPGSATIIYGAKEMFSGASVGVGVSKQIVGLTGIVAHGASAVSGTSVATGGTSHAAISGTVGTINGGLSAIITEKMGWGFVTRIKQNKMNWKDQLSEASSYLTARSFISGLDIIGESAESVKELIQSCPEGSRATLGSIYNLVHETGADTYSGMFFINLGTRFGSELLTNKGNLTRERKSEIIKDSIFDTAAFIAADRLIEHGINENVLRERQKIETKLTSAPEVFQDFMINVKYSKLHDLVEPTRDTLNKLKDKDNLNALKDTIKGLQEMLTSSIKEADKSFEEAELRRIEDKKSTIKDIQLKPKFIYPVQRALERKSASIPNCIMIVGNDSKVNEELIEWTGQNANCRFLQIDHTDNILKYLKNSENNFKDIGDRTLLHIRNFEKLINPEITPAHVIADIKDLMSSASEDFHSTIIFSTTDPSRLDKIAIQPHRIEKIDANIK